MPPKQTTGGQRGRPQGSTNRRSNARESSDESSNPFDSAEDEDVDQEAEEEEAPPPPRRQQAAGTAANRSSEPEKTIPKNLLTRVLHEFFEKDATRISRDANGAVGRYMDVFVREAIARAAVEKRSGFLEVRMTGS